MGKEQFKNVHKDIENTKNEIKSEEQGLEDAKVEV